MIMAGIAVIVLPTWMWVILRISHGGKGWPRRRNRHRSTSRCPQPPRRVVAGLMTPRL